MNDFGHSLPDGVDIRVWDSTAEIRYLVLPLPPKNVGDLSVVQLETMVSRDSMIGVAP
jgi:nitrile hydratase subunit alpha